MPQQNQYQYVPPQQQAPTKQRPAKEENDDKASKDESKDKDDKASQDKSDDNQKKTDDINNQLSLNHSRNNQHQSQIIINKTINQISKQNHKHHNKIANQHK
ncbi:DUF4887 domain-containing protein [Staphylococcus aureus]|nr:DUF4887 domain-containing protein [Staphylococcus aureus]